MSDTTSKHLIEKTEQAKRNYLINKFNHGSQDVQSILPIEHTSYRFPVATRSYLGNRAEPLTVLINHIIEVHNEMVIEEGLTDSASYEWHRYHCYQYNQLKAEAANVFNSIELFSRKKSRQGGTPWQRTEQFLTLVYAPLNTTFNSTQSVLNEFISNLVNCFVLYQYADCDGEGFPVNDAFFQHHRTLDVFKYSLRLSDLLDNQQTLENTLPQTIRNRYIDDLYEMREYFFKGWDPAKHIITYADGIDIQIDLQAPVIKLNFTLNVKDDTNRYDYFESVEINNQIYTASMHRAAFWLCEVFIDPVLVSVHKYLVELFSRTTIGQKRKKISNNQYEYKPYLIDIDNEDTDELQAIDTVIREQELSAKLFSTINLQKFRCLMESHFHCKFSSGKGSEIKIQREGTRIMTLGRHKKDPELSTYKVKETLKRLEIPVNEFIHALKCN
ncbi:MAG: hypothetical protein JKY55_00705 [Aliivibrio sp.]|uniref:hypothetical protein n=1 Tax=Aliivibrio sp. TaxID=1872443 RepID=UPI001A51B513|nr:hypothetical protein [Aliivibrio sp.]